MGGRSCLGSQRAFESRCFVGPSAALCIPTLSFHSFLGTCAGYEHSPSRTAFTSLVAMLHAIATARGQPALLSPAELTAYGAALASHRTADRMAFAGGDLFPCLSLLARHTAAALAWMRL